MIAWKGAPFQAKHYLLNRVVVSHTHKMDQKLFYMKQEAEKRGRGVPPPTFHTRQPQIIYRQEE